MLCTLDEVEGRGVAAVTVLFGAAGGRGVGGGREGRGREEVGG